jgi:ornithine carbamoyltransferase
MGAALDAADIPTPVVNLLSDDGHPCQALADMLTLRQHLGDLVGRTIAYVGDANNVCRSLVLAAALVGMRARVASPPGHGLTPADQDRVLALGGEVELTDSPTKAVAGVEAVYTDVWASMGQETEAETRREAFRGYTVDEALMARAAPGAVFLHCLPAHRGEEVSASVVDGPRSLVWQQAANRMHAMRGLLLWLLGSGAGEGAAASATATTRPKANRP